MRGCGDLSPSHDSWDAWTWSRHRKTFLSPLTNNVSMLGQRECSRAVVESVLIASMSSVYSFLTTLEILLVLYSEEIFM